MRHDYNLSSVFITVLMSLMSQVCPGQSFALVSNDDFGSEQMLYMDNEGYPMTELDVELLRIEYTFELGFVNDTTKRITMDYYLQIGRQYTKYVSKMRFEADSLLALGGKQTYGRALLYNKKANFLLVEDCYYSDFKNRRLEFTGRLAADDFRYEEDLPVINWQIEDGEKTLCGYTCKSASAVFRGRSYHAWYTEQLPSAAGPWKFNSLPGVILAIEEKGNACKMEAKAIKVGTARIVRTDYPYITVTRGQYEKLRQQLLNDPNLFSVNHSGRSNWTTNISEQHIPKPLPIIIKLEQK